MLPTTLPQVVGLFNIFVGVMLTLSIIIMGAAILMWIIRFGTWPSYRDEALLMMQWAVSMLFALDILILIVQFVQRHTAGAVYFLGFIILLLIAWAVLQAAKESGEHDEH